MAPPEKGGDVEEQLDREPLQEKDGPKAQGRPALQLHLCGLPAQAVSGAAYCASSASMVLLNKAALSSFGFTCPVCLVLFQCTVAAAAVAACQAAGTVRLQPWSLSIAALWLPVNALFVAMLWSSTFALRALGVPMATVLKNLTNILVIGGDYVLDGRVYGAGVWAALALMTFSAVCGAATDLAFSAEGYAWQLINCAATAAYSIYLRRVMDRAAALTADRAKLSELSMVLYNNALSLPLLACLAWAYDEPARLPYEPALRNPGFVFAACASAALGLGISFTSLWFLSTTTATTFSLVGSLNKVPIAVIGLLAFDVPWSPQNLASIGIGLVAGVVFVRAKQPPK